MASLNQVNLIGNLTRDPEGKRTTSGTSVISMGMAINRKWRDSGGNTKEETTFVDMTAFSSTADFCRDYLHKGDPVFVSGRLKLESWEDRNTGQKRSKLVIVADRVQSLGRSEGGQQQQAPAPQRPAPPPFPTPHTAVISASEVGCDPSWHKEGF